MLHLNRVVDDDEEVFKIQSMIRLARTYCHHSMIITLVCISSPSPIDFPAVYFLQPTQDNVQRIISDGWRAPPSIPPPSISIFHPLFEELITGLCKSGSARRLSKLHYQYLEFVTLEDNLFSLGLRNCYAELNDPAAGDKEIVEIIEKIVGGLFCILATLRVVPIIRWAPPGGPAEMVASVPDKRLRDHLLPENKIFTEGGFTISVDQRPILCIFDRDFDLSVAIQHDYRYKPLVHDVLGLRLNRLYREGEKGDRKKSYELNHSDPFWTANGSLKFPEFVAEITTLFNMYKKDVEELYRQTSGDEAQLDWTELSGNTKHLMNAVNSPELIEMKQVIEKHSNIATALLGEIKERFLDYFAKKESEMMIRGGIDCSELLGLLKGKGTKMDKLRFAIMYLLSTESISSSEIEAVETALKESEVDTSAFQYVKKVKSLNVSLASAANSASRSNIVDWVEKLYGQLIGAVTDGVKNLLSKPNSHQSALTRAVDALMEGKPNHEIDSYLVFDPCEPKPTLCSSGSHMKGPFKEAIVFMIGCGNYVEYGSLPELVRGHQPSKHVIYGTTEILSGGEFVDQLALLGQKLGLGSSHATGPNR